MKFNFFNKVKETITNHEGAKTYSLTPEMELYTAVVTSSLNNTFYEKADNRLERIQNLIEKNDPLFVAKLAIYARQQMYMRSLPLVLTVELAKSKKTTIFLAKMVTGVVQRADEITELLAYYQLANNRTETKKLNKLSKQIQKGLAASFNQFDEYQFAKYDKATAVTLRDALFLVHPKAKDEHQQQLFDKIATKKLDTPYTWETELSALGQQKFDSEIDKLVQIKNKWEELIDSKKLGYMALLRNLRNILDADVSYVHIQKICDYLSDITAVANSKQFPFRFLAAYRELKDHTNGYTNLVLQGLEKAIKASIINMKGFDENTTVTIAADVSGSMQFPISPRSKVFGYDIALVLAMLLQSKCKNVITGMFGDTWKTINVSSTNILANVGEFYQREGEVGYSTNGYLVIKDLLNRKKVMDKVMLFTDMQLYDSTQRNTSIQVLWKEYKKIAPMAKLYLFDVKGYGTTPLDIKTDDVYVIAGWSDRIFDILESLENGVDALQKINQIAL